MRIELNTRTDLCFGSKSYYAEGLDPIPQKQWPYAYPRCSVLKFSTSRISKLAKVLDEDQVRDKIKTRPNVDTSIVDAMRGVWSLTIDNVNFWYKIRWQSSICCLGRYTRIYFQVRSLRSTFRIKHVLLWTRFVRGIIKEFVRRCETSYLFNATPINYQTS